MAKPVKMLAFDFGASSGRAILGILEDGKIRLEEIHRFSNDPVEVRGSMHWDTLRLFHEIKQGILKCANGGHRDISSIAVDTWGVDFGLLDADGNMLSNPYHYRDSRTDGIVAEVLKLVPEEELYSRTGIELMKINTIFQLYSLKLRKPAALNGAETMLMTPDLFNYFLTGEKVTEYSIASTTQLVDAAKRDWSWEIIDRLGLPEKLFTKIVPSGTIIGRLSPELADELGIGRIPVIAAAGHDTQAAIASVPAEEKDYVFISCGTWSLVGMEADSPVIGPDSRKAAFTNEGGADNKISFMKNIMGLWLIQECRRQWEREGIKYSYSELEKLGNDAQPFVSFIDPAHESFIAPGDMPGRIRQYCRSTGQPVPESTGEVVRCIMQSLALKYRATVDKLEELTGKSIKVIHMVGGGIKDKTLCSFTAGATGRTVVAGPVEATSAGNLMLQAIAMGYVGGLQEARRIVAGSFPVEVYEPGNVEKWDEAYKKASQIRNPGAKVQN